MTVIGIDESYKNIGISVIKDNEVIKHKSYSYKGCKNKTEKRKYVKKMIKYFTNRYKCDIIILERVRHFSAGFMSKSYIAATSALIACIVDTAYEFNIPVYSVDTRSWKSQIVGTSKHKENESKKQPTIDFVQNVLGIDVKDDDEADAICIGLYGFIPKEKQKLIKET